MRIGGLGLLEIVAILAVILILFGPGRIAKVAGELGQGIKAFKDGITGNKNEEKEESPEAEEKKK